MSIKFTILGCGSSLGIPRIDDNFGKCDPRNRKNYRTRCSALISVNDKNILIDTSPDIKNQLIKNKIKNIERVFFTHYHADQTHGINELRVFHLISKKKIPVYADNNTKKFLLNSFKYCFKSESYYPAFLEMNNLNKYHNFFYNKKKISIKRIFVRHGNINSIAYIINNKCAYIPDVNEIYDSDLGLFKNLKYLVVDCFRYKPHFSHYNLSNVLDFVKIIKPIKTILTNLSADIDYGIIKKKLPKNIVPAYDGMSFNI